MFESTQRLSKHRVEVELQLDNGSRLLAAMSIGQGQRISDLMNDERQFLPLQMPGGKVVILRKSVIARVAPLDQHIEQDDVTDPYEILGVSPNISDAELKKHYHAACSENHPDKALSSGLSPQFVEMANSRMIRINEAYRQILETRGAKSNGHRDGSDGDPFG